MYSGLVIILTSVLPAEMQAPYPPFFPRNSRGRLFSI